MYSSPYPIEGLLDNQGCVLDLGELFARFATLRDKRSARGRRYSLAALLSIATLARLAGCQHTAAIAAWARLRARGLARLLGLPRHVMPSLRTWNRVLGTALEAQALEQLLGAYLARVLSREPGEDYRLAAVDGKTLRGTIRVSGHGVHLLAIYLPAEGLVLAQAEVGPQTNETGAAAALFAQVDLAGLVVTGDAMFTYRSVCLQILAGQGDYVLAVKENQPRLHEAIQTLFAPQAPRPGTGKVPTDFTQATSHTQGHGREETRTITVSGMLQGYDDWPGLAQVYRIESHTRERVTERETQGVRYGITSLPPERATPAQLLGLVRGHWGIESGLHYRRDVTLGEDRGRVCLGQAAWVHAALNNLIIALLHSRASSSLAQSLRELSYQIERRLALLDLP